MANATKKTILLSAVIVLLAILLLAASSVFASVTQTHAFAESWDDFATPEEEVVGLGTYVSPYVISSSQDLARMSLWVNADINRDSYYVLDTDIDLAGRDFTPIGNIDYPFIGNFDGGGHTISGLQIEVLDATGDSRLGLFGVVGNAAVVQTFGIVSANINFATDQVFNTAYVGSIAGQNLGTIRNVFSYAKLGGDISGASVECLFGGLVGKNEGTIESAVFGGEITLPQPITAVGGITGDNSATIQNVYNSGKLDCIDPMGWTYVGGIVGINPGHLAYAINAGPITNAITVGGITASRGVSPITFCYYDSDLSLTTTAVFGQDDINQDTNKVKGLSSAELYAATPNSLGFTVGTWAKYAKSFDGGVYYAPYIVAVHNVDTFYSEVAAKLHVFGFDRAKIFDTVNRYGSKGNPYFIQTAAHFANLAEHVNNGTTTYAGKYFLAIGDADSVLDLSGFDGTVGTKGHADGDKPFMGNFNGNNVTISNYKIDRTNATSNELKNNIGLFGFVGTHTIGTDDAFVYNLTLDDSCSVVAGEYVGSVVGYNAGKVDNIETQATVRGRYFVGGVIGFNYTTASLNGILCVGKVLGDSGASNIYGIVGGGYFQNSTNVWYVTTISSAYRDTQNRGRALIVDIDDAITYRDPATGRVTFGKRGEDDQFYQRVTVSKDSTGKITFDGYADSPWDIEYRLADQMKVSDTTIYEPPRESTETRPVYARLVRTLNARVGIDNKSRLYFSKTNIGGTDVYHNSDKFYRGQDIVMYSEVPEAAYLRRTMAILQNPIDSSEIEEPSFTFTYSNNINDPRVVVRLTMATNLVAVRPDFSDINAPSAEPKTYDGTGLIYMSGGEPYSVSVPGFLVDYSYSVAGGAPRNVGNYGLTVNVRSTDGVLRGRQTIGYAINPRSIVVTADLLTRQKEYDGSTAPVAAPIINQSGISGIVPGDALVVSSMASYNSSDIGWTTADFSFTLSGAAAINYYPPATMISVSCEITKRTLIIEIKPEDLTYVYDGEAAEIPYKGYVLGRAPLVWLTPVVDVYMSVDIVNTRIQAIDVGTYDVNVKLKDSPEYNYEGRPITYYYTIQLAQDYQFTITPKPVDITYGDYEGLVYNGLSQHIKAYYFDVDGTQREVLPECIAYTLVPGTGDPTDANILKSAGDYQLLVTLPDGGNYVATAATNTFAMSMAKADQPPITVTTLVAPFVYGDAPRALTITGAANDSTGEVVYTVRAGNAVITDSFIEFTGGGDIYLFATKAGDYNYHEATTPNYRITVQKAVIQINLQDITRTYGDTLLILDYVFEGWVDRDVGKTKPDGFIEPTVIITGAQTDETINKHKKYDAGEYTLHIQQNALSTGYTFDYSLLEPEPIYTVLQKKVILRPDGKEQIYGNEDLILTYTVYDGDEPFGSSLVDIVLSRESGREALYGNDYYAISCDNTEAAAAANPNYSISFEQGEYRILPRTLTLTAVSITKAYGEADPINLPLVSGLAPGDTFEDTVFARNPALPLLVRQAGENAHYNYSRDYGVYYYSSSNVRLSTNYTLVFISGTLTIYKSMPTIGSQSELNVPYGDNIDTLQPRAEFYVELGGQKRKVEGALTWIDGGARPTFEGENLFGARFVPAANYDKDLLENNCLTADVRLAVGIHKRPVELDIETLDLTYTGRSQRLKIAFGNVLEGDDLGQTVTYSADMEDAGDYTVEVAIANGNYTLIDGETETDKLVFQVILKKAPLVIYLKDIELGQGIRPPKDFIYEGFVNGEDEDALTTKPDVDFKTEAGNYEITPYGATSDNYAITYRPSRQSVTKTLLTSEVQNLTIAGNFDFQTELEATEITKSSNRTLFSTLNANLAPIKSLNKLGNVQLSRIYKIDITVAGESAGLDSVAKATLELPARLRESKRFYVVLINEDGTMKLAQNVVRTGNNLSFDIEDCSMIGIVNPPDYTFIILGCVVVILIISVFALDMVSERLGLGRHKKKKASKTDAKK